MSSPADRLVYALKYEGWRELAGEMAKSMAALVLPEELAPPTMVIPVPTTERRLRERGYNQADLLALGVAGIRGLPVVRPLTRVRGGPTQVSLRPSQRRANVSGVFEVTGYQRELRGVHALLVDDVLTTGATAGAAADALVRGGAAAVTLMTFARALPFDGQGAR